jgi:hypothetical protein
MPGGRRAAFGADLAVLLGAAWYLVPRWALLWVLFYHIFKFYYDFKIMINFQIKVR